MPVIPSAARNLLCVGARHVHPVPRAVPVFSFRSGGSSDPFFSLSVFVVPGFSPAPSLVTQTCLPQASFSLCSSPLCGRPEFISTTSKTRRLSLAVIETRFQFLFLTSNVSVYFAYIPPHSRSNPWPNAPTAAAPSSSAANAMPTDASAIKNARAAALFSLFLNKFLIRSSRIRYGKSSSPTRFATVAA